jgi:hypothetical protein
VDWVYATEYEADKNPQKTVNLLISRARKKK